MRQAHVLAQKSAADDVKVTEQPFPDSWLATTAPIALGMLSDIASEFIVYRGSDGREDLWPIISRQYRKWIVGYPRQSGESWTPCEALVRVSSHEIFRFGKRIFEVPEFSDLSTSDQTAWTSCVFSVFTDILSSSIDLEGKLKHELLESKDQAEAQNVDDLGLDDPMGAVNTPFGNGQLVSVQKQGETGTVATTNVILLDFGATLYQPVVGTAITEPSTRVSASDDIPLEVDGRFTLCCWTCDLLILFVQFQTHCGFSSSRH